MPHTLTTPPMAMAIAGLGRRWARRDPDGEQEQERVQVLGVRGTRTACRPDTAWVRIGIRVSRSRRPRPEAEPVGPAGLHDPQEQRVVRKMLMPPRRRGWIHGKSTTWAGTVSVIAYRIRGMLTTLKKPCWYWASWRRPGDTAHSRSPRGCRSARRCTGGRRRMTRATSRPAGQATRSVAREVRAGVPRLRAVHAEPAEGRRVARACAGAVDEVGDEERRGHGDRQARHDRRREGQADQGRRGVRAGRARSRSA